MSRSQNVSGNENGKDFPEKGKVFPADHDKDCDWHTDQYPWECTCGAIHRAPAVSIRESKS